MREWIVTIAGAVALAGAAMVGACGPAPRPGSQTMPTSQTTDWSALHKRYPPGDGKGLPLPDDWRRVEYPSTADDSNQGAWFYTPAETGAGTPCRPGAGSVPLLVILHPWSSDQDTHHRACVRWCIDHAWAAIAPDFRGANRRPQACGSELVVKDILSAVEWAKAQAAVDANRVYLIGTSGGGHAALLMAGRAPQGNVVRQNVRRRPRGPNGVISARRVRGLPR